MNIAKLSPAVAERVEFTLKHQRRVPAAAGCYVLTTFAGEILYIGLSKNINRRFSQHRDSEDKRGETTLGVAYWFWFSQCPELDLEMLERSWLSHYMLSHGALPPLNKVSSPLR